MQQLETLLYHKSNILFIAPTGWGKTTLLLDLVKNSTKSWVYMAPLRALANEFYLRSCKTIQGVYCPTTANEVRPLANKSLNFKLLIITPELCSESIIENHKENIQIVIDEFHLFYYWGDSFRPKLLELYEQVCSRELPLLLLSATIDEEIEKRWECEASLNYQNSFKINLGNQQIKKDPQKVIYFPLKRFKKLQLDYAKLKRGSHATLIFCKYRKEVERLALDFEKNGKKVLTCIGGETHLFHFKLAKCQKPDFIIATSALSHGVNLPLISEIYLTYPIENYDFWIQMVGRAGRRGEEFKVFTMNPFCLKNKQITWWQKVKSLANILAIVLITKMAKLVAGVEDFYEPRRDHHL